MKPKVIKISFFQVGGNETILAVCLFDIFMWSNVNGFEILK